MNKTNISFIKMSKTRCKHEPLIDTGVGYYFCPACRSSWTNEELKGSRPAYNDVDDENLYIWDGIVSELEKVKNFKDARKWVVENYCDGDKCHPDIESIEIFKKVGNVVLVETDDRDVCELELRALAGYAAATLQAPKEGGQQDIPMEKDAVNFGIWLSKNEAESLANDHWRFRNNSTHTTAQLYKIYKIESPKEEKES